MRDEEVELAVVGGAGGRAGEVEGYLEMHECIDRQCVAFKMHYSDKHDCIGGEVESIGQHYGSIAFLQLQTSVCNGYP